MDQMPTRKKILAIITGGISILIGVLYLVLITLLDSRGAMNPPPPEAFGAVGVVFVPYSSVVQLLFQGLYQ